MYLAENRMNHQEIAQVEKFLQKFGLSYDSRVDHTVRIFDEKYRMVGTGSLGYNVLKCIAVDQEYRGEGAMLLLVSALIEYAYAKGLTHIFVYTKRDKREFFQHAGFYEIVSWEDTVFMENRRNGIREYLESVKAESPPKALEKDCRVGAVVANCDPFTLGHQYLMETACRRCDYVHMFILSSPYSVIPFETRYQLVKEGTHGLDNIILHRTADYMIAPGTFPDYFTKSEGRKTDAACGIDLEVFGRIVAPELHIQARFTGIEPYCYVTNRYNQKMRLYLPEYGIAYHEMERKRYNGKYISASEVRALWRAKEVAQCIDMVPDATYKYLSENI